MSGTVNNSEIEKILAQACVLGNNKLKSGLFKYSSNSDDNELICLDLLKESALQSGLSPDSIILTGGASFPDVSIEGASCGIELKGSKSGSIFIGNSIYSSSHVAGINKIFLLYWIADRQEFGYRDYFECVSDVKVTHKPRYRLDINLEKNEGLFGVGENQIGLAEDIFFNSEGVQTELILNELRRRAIEAGEVPWWLPKSEDEEVGADKGTSEASLKYLGDIEREVSFGIQKSLFLGFPGVLTGGRSSHFDAIGWCISRRSVIVNRDVFSAGGKSEVTIDPLSTTAIQVPGVISNFIWSVGKQCPVSFNELSEIHGTEIRSVDVLKKKIKEALISGEIINKHVAEIVNQLGLTDADGTAVSTVIDWLLSHINDSGFVD
jgi:hypothetical protein